MTRNQIDYFKAKEEKRHNLAGEAETRRSNYAVEGETNRHNLATEALQGHANVINQAHYERMDAETKRSNLTKESETQRHNIVSERLQSAANAESVRHNKQNEAITYAHNTVTEAIDRTRANAYVGSIEISQQQADTQDRLADLKSKEVDVNASRSVYQNRLDAARAEQTATKTHYAQQENVRDWIDVLSNSAVRGTTAIKNVVGTVTDVINAIPKFGSKD